MFPFGVHGEPALPYAVMLLVQLQYAPEAGEGHDAKDDAHVFVLNKKGDCEGGNARQQECWPTLPSEIVFSLDDQGMEHPDGQKCSKADDDADPIHNG